MVFALLEQIATTLATAETVATRWTIAKIAVRVVVRLLSVSSLDPLAGEKRGREDNDKWWEGEEKEVCLKRLFAPSSVCFQDTTEDNSVEGSLKNLIVRTGEKPDVRD